MKFEYDAINAAGNQVSGTAEAESFIAFLYIMYQKRLHPMDVRQLTKATSEIERLHKLKKKIRGEPVIPEVKAKRMSTTSPESEKEKAPKDYTYLAFLMVILGLIAVIALSQGLVL